jgi:hypothetical protein
MDSQYVLTTSNIETPNRDVILGVFTDIESARIAGQWWCNYNNLQGDIWWSSFEKLETAQAGPKTWLHIRTYISNKLVD